MIRKVFLLILMGVPLVGAAAAKTPVPVLLAMGCLIVFAASLSNRSEQA
jgi:hypothetical protein